MITREIWDCFRWWSALLPAISPRLISILRNKDPGDPVRTCSDAAGAGKLAIISFLSNEAGHCPYLLATQADDEPEKLSAAPNKISIFALFAPTTTVCRRLDRLWGRRVILFVDDEAACVALTKQSCPSVGFFALGDSNSI